MVKIKVNAEEYEVEAADEKPLLWVLREDLKLTGTKYSCGIGMCGTCRVELDGQLIPSCITQISEVGSKEVKTVEGLQGEVAEVIEEAWLENEVSQCGYCQPGQLMTANHLLQSNPVPSAEQIENAMDGLCRCGSYQRIHQAVLDASSRLARDSRKGGA